ncbi:Laminin subunit alpha-2 [Dissostichus eleginoides]|uniref:Laminin subunit alpha-2 n=1 Tax=Dissostichus eleginoides TaxID=100907 RepID=A0AAD9BBI8_DISEL|nr:Laminin subunit alpha-2 [Dissostichus eleginoides]
MLASVTASFQLELRESRECYDANIRKSEEENLGKLESLRNEQQTVTDALRLEVLGLQDNIDSLNAKSEYNAKELARLQSLTVKEGEENENMKTAMHDLQDQLAKNKILIQEELKRTNEGEIAGKQMLASVTASLQLELRESRELFTLDQTKKAENQQLLETEMLALRERIAVITKDFESLTEQTQAKNEQLGHDHQKREVLLNEQNENLKTALQDAELESLRNEQQTVTDALRLKVLGLQDNIGVLREEKNSNADELAQIQSLTVKQYEENKNLKTEKEDYKDQLKDAKELILVNQELFTLDQTKKAENQQLLETEMLALRERIAVITKEFESLTEQTQAKNEQLGHDHQKREVLLNEQNENLKTALQLS